MPNHKLSRNLYLDKIRSVESNKPYCKPFKDEAQTALFKDTVRTALSTLFISVIRTNQFMLYGAEVAVCSEINAKHIQCGLNVQFFNVKLVGASSDQ